MNLPDWLQSVLEHEDNLARATTAAQSLTDEAETRRVVWEIQYAAERIVWACEEFFLMASVSDADKALHELCQAHREYVKRIDEIKDQESF